LRRASHVAPDLIVERNGKSVFARQPETRRGRACRVARRARVSDRVGTQRNEAAPPARDDLSAGDHRRRVAMRVQRAVVLRCALLLRRAPERQPARRFAALCEGARRLVRGRRRHRHILLSHQDDVADAGKYAERFGARVWIHHADRHAAPYATDLIEGESARIIVAGLVAIPVPGHTRGSVVYLLDDRVLFAGDSLAWSMREQDLVAFRDACWYSWSALAASLAKLAGYRFRVGAARPRLAAHCDAEEMNARLTALVARMREG
jgi:hypothetical protein